MKLQIGLIVNRITGETTPLYREATEEECREAHETMIKRAAANFYDVVVEELEKRIRERTNGKV